MMVHTLVGKTDIVIQVAYQTTIIMTPQNEDYKFNLQKLMISQIAGNKIKSNNAYKFD